MKKYLLNFRDQLIFESWETYKSRVTMEELAKVFNMPLKTIYRIVRQESLKVGNKKINK